MLLNKFKSASIVAALICTSLAASGCGSGNSTPGTTTGGVAVGYNPGAYVPGVVTPISAAGGTLSFSGSNVMTNLGYVGTTTGWGAPPANDSNFQYPQAQNTLTLGSYSASVGATGTLVGNCGLYPGTSISLIATPQSAYSSGLTGYITLSSAFMMANYPQGMPAPIGVAIDVWATTNQLYGGMVYICTARDQSGNCHGAYFPVNP
ncbi:MAG: hypothetical protein HY074_01275 [Deltaproteobacteria bacterium]|nr:hypothetical protein [Deltaproteobacteria bacterium]